MYDTEVIVKCGKCKNTYHEMAEANDYFVILRSSKCPLCGFDNSGKAIIEIGGEKLN